MKKFIIKGIDVTAPNSTLSLGEFDNSLKVAEKGSVVFASARDEGSDKEISNIKDDDVMLLEFENGIHLWTRVDQFETDFLDIKARNTEPGILEIPRQLPIGGSNRGVSDWILKTLNIFGVDPVSKTATSIAKLVEKQLDQAPGIYQCIANDVSNKETQYRLKLRKPVEKLDGTKPVLLFLHGTASSSAGSFGELWNQSSAAYLNQLQSYFGDHIYAFEHRTLSESPIENAIDLLKALDELADKAQYPIQLHLVSHSRGGLVGELLARMDVAEGKEPISEFEIEQYAEAGKEYKKQAQNLKTLNALLNSKFKSGVSKGLRKFTVHRFVRTACPARGTTLASGRLDRWLSITMNLIGQIPLLKASLTYDAFSTFTLSVVKERTDPKDMPGLEAQMPGSPLIRLLNLSNSVVQGDLSIISGDIEPDTFWGKLKLLIPDLYYRHDHDLVVDTLSMSGGTPRMQNNVRTFFDQGPGVNHFQYFSNGKTANMLVQGLIRAEGDHAGFTPVSIEPELLGSRSGRVEGDKPIVLLLPGILGSHLQVKNNRIWLDLFDIALGRMKRLGIDAEDISAEALVGSAYADFIRFLEQQHDVFPFPFDWRLSIETEAQRFAIELESKLQQAEQHNQPIHIIAHSMGGLVARMAFALNSNLWDRLVASDGRLLMLGTPLKGSHVMARTLVGQEKMMKYLSLLDFAHNQKELLEIISTFPGAIQLLPYQHGVMDLLDEKVWDKLNKADDDGWIKPIKQNLLDAKNFWKQISKFKMNHENMLYVAGKAPETPMDIEIDSSDKEDKKIVFLATAKGDGRVTWESGIPANIRSWFVDTGHGNLADYKKAFPAFVELLQQGNTSNPVLSTEPVLARGESEKPFRMAVSTVDMFPDEAMIIDSIMGTERNSAITKTSTALKVIISHGDLCFATNSLAIGHYHDDLIISAESYINKLFDDRLRKRMLLGLYPGPLNTAQVIYNSKQMPAKPEAVLIIGLDVMGSLTRNTLAETFCHAALEYAVAVIEKHNNENHGKDDCTELKLSSLLIGTGAGGISIEDSLMAMIQGINNANKQLQQMQCGGYQFVELEFIERWEDIANAAAHAMRIIGEDPGLDGVVVYEPALLHCSKQRKAGAKVNKIEGARRRITFCEAEGWWRRLQIHHIAADDSLRFNILTDKARTEISLQPIDLVQVDTFIEQSIQSTYDNPELSKTLFEMLLPHSIKEQTQNQKDLVLVLNEKAARYPWELLQDRWAHKTRDSASKETLPMSVEFGMIRQLESETFRATSSLHGSNALIIGNPIGDTEYFPELIGAENEAKAVNRMLSSKNYAVTKVLGKDSMTDAQRVIHALHADSYRIMHFAGHGVYEHHRDDASKLCDICGQHVTTTKKITGMVIGKNAFLTPANIKSIRFVPDLVFINCCHLGREEGKHVLKNPHQLAANLATEFIRMGVKAVIATGWAVNDRAAETFATTFYNLMLEGHRFGNAVRMARAVTYKSYKGSNTWGAYQCYGNPDFQLTLNGGERNNHYVEESVSEAELVEKIDNLAKDISISGAKADDLKGKLDKLLETIPVQWIDKDVHEALGRTYGELGVLGKAIEHYKAALNDEKTSASLKTIEQFAKLQAKLAVEQWQANPAGSANDKPLQLIDNSINLMTDLLKFGINCERLCILAGIYRYKAWISGKGVRTDALKQMEACYQQASAEKPNDKTSLFNYLTAQTLVNWSEKETDKTLQEKIDTLTLSRPDCQHQTSFCKLSEYANYQLLKNLSQQSLDQNVSSIIEYYLSAKKYASGQKEFNPVIEYIEFMVIMAESQIAAGKKKSSIANPLREILYALTH